MEKQTQIRIPPETTRQLMALKELWGDATLTLALARAIERVYTELKGGMTNNADSFTQSSFFDANCSAEDDT
jgi:hypothetical protein